MDINIDKECGYISWHNENKKVLRKVEGLYHAFLDKLNSKICVQIADYGNDGSVWFNLNGDNVCSFDLLQQEYMIFARKDKLPAVTESEMYYDKINALLCLYRCNDKYHIKFIYYG
ncbi:hypothetical protein [Selenomonas ruminantium]|uniref:Uncharacterized protein n=1 Tax=Selenomonas ruminantium TaxID=971 RepID=A0A1I0VFQ6_SELRU|nr:hypothetical protein [Selenomonas ruminantium]SFA74810.1 hypothetical protein SAMN05216587_101547 [Selenomonas ruminantium]